MKIQQLKSVAWSTAAALVVGSVAQAQISFAPAVTYGSGPLPRDVAAADFDNDGWPDLAVTLHDPARLSLLRNLGDGTFAAPEFLELTGASDLEGLIAADFDNDGLLDIAFDSCGTDEVWVLHNLGDAHFVAIARIPVGGGPCDLAAGDIDCDGDLDLATSNRFGDSVTVIRNLSWGQFAVKQTLAVGLGPREVQFGHFATFAPRGAALDLAVSVHDSHELVLLRNDGSGVFVPLTVLAIPGQSNPEGLVVGDFDGNGSDDVAACFTGSAGHKVAVFHQSHHGVFGEPQCFNVGAYHPTDMVAVDFDRDTRLDIAFISSEFSRVTALRKLEGGLFGMQGMFDVPGPHASHLSCADFDRDGVIDLVATNDDAASVSVLVNERTNPSNYCFAAPNSVGEGARIGSSGAPSISLGKFMVWVTDAPPRMTGLFFYGHTPTIAPFQHGYLCVAPPIVRLRPLVMTSTSGVAQFVPDFDRAPMGVGPTAITPGSVWNFQFWYRDAVAGGRHYTNLSDGLRVIFEP